MILKLMSKSNTEQAFYFYQISHGKTSGKVTSRQDFSLSSMITRAYKRNKNNIIIFDYVYGRHVDKQAAGFPQFQRTVEMQNHSIV